MPQDKNGSLTTGLGVPSGSESIRLIPAISLFHQNRVSLNEDGLHTCLTDAPNRALFASDRRLDPQSRPSTSMLHSRNLQQATGSFPSV